MPTKNTKPTMQRKNFLRARRPSSVNRDGCRQMLKGFPNTCAASTSGFLPFHMRYANRKYPRKQMAAPVSHTPISTFPISSIISQPTPRMNRFGEVAVRGGLTEVAFDPVVGDTSLPSQLVEPEAIGHI